jgi:CubicO group peptidase (beta-lactamase class C family)
MADLEHDVPITPDSVFYVGSVSKQFVAFTLLLLEEQGRVSLEDDIRKYLPEFPDYGTPITIRHLIHHTSGIRDYLQLWVLSGRDYLDRVPVQAAYDLICRQKKLNFSPGEQHLYSNSCYFLIPLIVEKVTGQVFKDFAQEQIFDPLGMENSHFHSETSHIIPNRAVGYEQRVDRSFGSLAMRFALVGSGGLYTTVRDLAKWDANFYDNKLGLGNSEIIEKMYSNGYLKDGTELEYAFALVNGSYRGLRTVRHSGALGGYRAQLIRFPDQRFSVVVLSNLASIDPLELAYEMADLHLQEQLGEATVADDSVAESGEETRIESFDLSLTASELAEYAGVFFSEELRAGCTISVRNGKLMLKIDYSLERPLRVLDADRFGIDGSQIRFWRDATGRLRGFFLDSEGIEDLLFVKNPLGQ